MKIIFLALFCFCTTTAYTATGWSQSETNFKSNIARYKKYVQPSPSLLQHYRWKYIGISYNHDLLIARKKRDHYNEDGLKNGDGSQMHLEFHQTQDLMLSKINDYREGNHETNIPVAIDNKSQSATFISSVYPGADTSALYYTQHCRVHRGLHMLCISVLGAAPDLVNRLPAEELKQALNKVVLTQEFAIDL